MKLRTKIAIMLNAEETERNLKLLNQLDEVGIRELNDEDRQFISDLNDLHERAIKACKA